MAEDSYYNVVTGAMVNPHSAGAVAFQQATATPSSAVPTAIEGQPGTAGAKYYYGGSMVANAPPNKAVLAAPLETQKTPAQQAYIEQYEKVTIPNPTDPMGYHKDVAYQPGKPALNVETIGMTGYANIPGAREQVIGSIVGQYLTPPQVAALSPGGYVQTPGGRSYYGGSESVFPTEKKIQEAPKVTSISEKAFPEGGEYAVFGEGGKLISGQSYIFAKTPTFMGTPTKPAPSNWRFSETPLENVFTNLNTGQYVSVAIGGKPPSGGEYKLLSGVTVSSEKEVFGATPTGGGVTKFIPVRGTVGLYTEPEKKQGVNVVVPPSTEDFVQSWMKQPSRFGESMTARGTSTLISPLDSLGLFASEKAKEAWAGTQAKFEEQRLMTAPKSEVPYSEQLMRLFGYDTLEQRHTVAGQITSFVTKQLDMPIAAAHFGYEMGGLPNLKQSGLLSFEHGYPETKVSSVLGLFQPTDWNMKLKGQSPQLEYFKSGVGWGEAVAATEMVAFLFLPVAPEGNWLAKAAKTYGVGGTISTVFGGGMSAVTGQPIDVGRTFAVGGASSALVSNVGGAISTWLNPQRFAIDEKSVAEAGFRQVFGSGGGVAIPSPLYAPKVLTSYALTGAFGGELYSATEDIAQGKPIDIQKAGTYGIIGGITGAGFGAIALGAEGKGIAIRYLGIDTKVESPYHGKGWSGYAEGEPRISDAMEHRYVGISFEVGGEPIKMYGLQDFIPTKGVPRLETMGTVLQWGEGFRASNPSLAAIFEKTEGAYRGQFAGWTQPEENLFLYSIEQQAKLGKLAGMDYENLLAYYKVQKDISFGDTLGITKKIYAQSPVTPFTREGLDTALQSSENFQDIVVRKVVVDQIMKEASTKQFKDITMRIGGSTVERMVEGGAEEAGAQGREVFKYRKMHDIDAAFVQPERVAGELIGTFKQPDIADYLRGKGIAIRTPTPSSTEIQIKIGGGVWDTLIDVQNIYGSPSGELSGNIYSYMKEKPFILSDEGAQGTPLLSGEEQYAKLSEEAFLRPQASGILSPNPERGLKEVGKTLNLGLYEAEMRGDTAMTGTLKGIMRQIPSGVLQEFEFPSSFIEISVPRPPTPTVAVSTGLLGSSGIYGVGAAYQAGASVSSKSASSFLPSASASFSPSTSASSAISLSPSPSASKSPSIFPSYSPGYSPSKSPSISWSPSLSPSSSPSISPSLSLSPSTSPSLSPSMSPSSSPSTSPSKSPSQSPSPSQGYYYEFPAPKIGVGLGFEGGVPKSGFRGLKQLRGRGSPLPFADILSVQRTQLKFGGRSTELPITGKTLGKWREAAGAGWGKGFPTLELSRRKGRKKKRTRRLI